KYSATKSRIRARNSSARSVIRQKFTIPINRSSQSVVQFEQRRPCQLAPSLCGTKILVVNLIAYFITNLRFEFGIHQLQQTMDQLQDRHLNLVREVKCLTCAFWSLGKTFRKKRVGSGAILDVEVIPNVGTVGPNDGTLTVQD